ncbi:unnamed protein product [Didymodactylos carnosus]|uniref:Transporter n=1 Tax=Didymodactylos carnosus TaxID=1234261 RepID=A0A8S2MQK0_9BILA|nr:unnamed protein product [Didymodactylos carnosus]CAF3968170.1 unnamed protein product [Didymodactylos carnosus]
MALTLLLPSTENKTSLAELDNDTKDNSDLLIIPQCNVSSEEEKLPVRETWPTKCDYLVTTLGGLIGLGSIWRFPYLAFQNGGATFVIPYVIISLLCGIPLLMMETALGQFSSEGPVGCWNFAPAMKGIGIASVLISFSGALYYVMIMVWGGIYLVHSFATIGKQLPWSDNAIENLAGINSTLQFSNQSVITSVEKFWNDSILNKSHDLSGLSTFHWPNVVGLFVMWCIIYFCLWKGIKLTSRVAVFTAFFPYIPMIALFIRGITLEGSWYGLQYYLIPDVKQLLSSKAWTQAAGHVLWAYGIGWGIIPALSSYNRPDYNFFNDILITGTTSILTNIFSGFVVFPVTCESVLTGAFDKISGLRKKKKKLREIIVAIYVLISFLCGLPMCTKAGFYIFNLFDSYICGTLPLLIICIIELFTVLFCYRTTLSSWFEKRKPNAWPGKLFIRHISEVLKRNLTFIWICWLFIIPIWLFGMLSIAEAFEPPHQQPLLAITKCHVLKLFI